MGGRYGGAIKHWEKSSDFPVLILMNHTCIANEAGNGENND